MKIFVACDFADEAVRLRKSFYYVHRRAALIHFKTAVSHLDVNVVGFSVHSIRRARSTTSRWLSHSVSVRS